jgi:uncharacterized protein YsxB (DUF464 family)
VVTVTFRRDSRNRLSSLFADGHAGAGEPGEDVVCAAVSALLQAAWVGLTDHARVTIEGERRAGRLTMRWPEETRDREDVRAIVATAELAVGQIATQSPDWVRIRREQET